nr:immunoglobulin heavy chain junction region [Macaca mulatta]
CARQAVVVSATSWNDYYGELDYW